LKPKNTEALKRLVREIMVRNRRSDTAAIASRRKAEVVEIELSSDERAFYQRMTAFVRGYYQRDSLKPVAGVNQFILKTLQREVGSSVDAVIPTLQKMANNPHHPESLRRVMSALAVQGQHVTGRAKTEALVRLIDSLPDKVIVFTSFMETQRHLAETLSKLGYTVAELHGEMTRQQKEDQVALFAGDANILVSTETGSEGRNLQFCRLMINFDLPWNPMRIEQRIGRIHRIGQANDVFIYNLSAAGTVESYILELLDAKINMFQLVVGELDMILGNLKEKKDFEDLIMDIWAGSDEEAVVRQEMDLLGNDLIEARNRYVSVKQLDEQLLGQMSPED
jgi:SNF2 family DNA or RNA helicase